jgi:hypothetical protein
VVLEKLRHGAFECGEAGVDLDHLVRADGFGGVSIAVLGPLCAALTAMEETDVGVSAKDVYGRVDELAAARTIGPISGLQPRLLH